MEEIDGGLANSRLGSVCGVANFQSAAEPLRTVELLHSALRSSTFAVFDKPKPFAVAFDLVSHDAHL